MISTRLHGILDYVVAVILIAYPWIFSVAGNNAETIVPVALGIATILYSLCTRYELGVWKLLPMETHLTFDLINAVILATSPLWFEFIDRIYLPYLVGGFAELLVIVLSKKHTETQHNATMVPGNKKG